MKIFLIILSLLLAVILQTTILSVLDISGVSPNLVLVLILTLVIFSSFRKLWWVIVLAGLFLDFFSGLPFGLISLSLATTAFLVDWFSRNVFSTTSFWIRIVLVVLAGLVYNILLIVLIKLFQFDLALSFKYLLIEFLYNLIIAIIFLYGAKKIFYQK